MNRLSRNPFQELDYQGEDFLTEAALQIYRYIDTHFVDREDDRDVLRGSAAPQCVRARWFRGRGIRGRRMAPRSIINFLLGHIFEMCIKHFIKEACVGPGKLYSQVNFGKVTGTVRLGDIDFEIHEQLEGKTRVGPLVITNHFDAIGLRNLDKKWELIEAKSSSDFGFMKFKTTGPERYLNQAHSNMMSEELRALNVTETRYFYGRKQTGHPYDRLFHFNDEIAEQTRREFIQSVGPQPPPPPHSLQFEKNGGDPSGRIVAKTFPCGMCEYLNTEHCHNNLRPQFRKDRNGQMRPTWVANTKR